MAKKQVQVSLTHEQIEQIDKLAAEQERSRSYIIAEFVARNLEWMEVHFAPSQIVALIDREYVTGVNMIGYHEDGP